MITKYLKPKPPASSSTKASTEQSNQQLRFDILIARVSLVMEAVGLVGMTLSHYGSTFLASSVMGALGGGFTPAINSIGLEVYRRTGGNETGKLLGALGVLQVFGFVFIMLPLNFG